MLTATITSNPFELQQIRSLQQANLARNLSSSEIKSQGFVTLNHTQEVLQLMHDLAPSIIIKNDEQVIGYA